MDHTFFKQVINMTDPILYLSMILGLTGMYVLISSFSDDDDDSNDDEDDSSLSKGDRVEAKLKGWTKYYKGKVTRVNRDGTYDILFDDGERKSKVDIKLIRSLESKSKKKTKNLSE